jgi:hypothetical protein
MNDCPMKNIPLAAQKLGTVNQIDRAKQYTRADNPELLRSLNEAWSKIRALEAARAEDAKIIDRLHKKLGSQWRHNLVTALISAATALAWEIGRIFAPIALRWLGVN